MPSYIKLSFCWTLSCTNLNLLCLVCTKSFSRTLSCTNLNFLWDAVLHKSIIFLDTVLGKSKFSLMTQPTKIPVKKGPGSIVCKLFQTLECDATNQIALFATNAQSTQLFIMKIIFTKNAAWMWHNMVVLMSKGLYEDFEWARYQVNPAITSLWYYSDTVPSVVYMQRGYSSFPWTLLVRFALSLHLLTMGRHFACIISLP